MWLALSEDFQIWRHVGNFSSMLLMPWLMLWWLCSGPVTCCIINVSKPDSFDGCRHHLGPGSPCSLADNAARHAVSVSSGGFIQVVMAPTIRANKTDFSSDIFCRYSLHPYVVARASSVVKCTCVLLIGTDDSWWQAMTAASCARLRPRPESLKTVNTHQLRPDCRHRRTLALRCKRTSSSASPGPGNLAGNQRLSVTYVVTRPADPGHQPLSGRHHVHPLRHLDGRFLQGRRDAIVS